MPFQVHLAIRGYIYLVPEPRAQADTMGGGGSTSKRLNLYVISIAPPDNDAPIDWIGTSLKSKRGISMKDFKVESLIGTGMLGHVVTAQHKPSRLYFAIKSMWKADVVERNMVKQVVAEKQAMEELRHPFLVQCFDTFQSDDQIHFVLEYIPGGELFKWLQEYGQFYDHEAKFFAAELVLVLEFIHAKGYIYRDLKPENIVLDAHGHVKLIDFGFAKPVDDNNGRCSTSVGTPQYLAPEQLKPGGSYTQAVDWWAFGCVVFELLMGATPFFRATGESSFELYTRVLKGKLSFGDRFTPQAKDLLRQLLRPDLSKRLTDATKIKNHPWFRDIEWSMVEARRLEPPVRPTLRVPGDCSNFDTHNDEPARGKKKSLGAKFDAAFAAF
ncbi:Aste57867_15279 [Aphanomyces stellatus]|uniref:Aste57867_15279 protein n=1 Tax=Aphanomyces stellatus TaxID=120398 RepID=A0A485L3Q9_9STRA|nr:hypothetical protein As57867_015223 [Aphanomyces stellatus]VFT92088.1 Aste57867_15279 [Aphanomyces stellatus]